MRSNRLFRQVRSLAREAQSTEPEQDDGLIPELGSLDQTTAEKPLDAQTQKEQEQAQQTEATQAKQEQEQAENPEDGEAPETSETSATEPEASEPEKAGSELADTEPIDGEGEGEVDEDLAADVVQAETDRDDAEFTQDIDEAAAAQDEVQRIVITLERLKEASNMIELDRVSQAIATNYLTTLGGELGIPPVPAAATEGVKDRPVFGNALVSSIENIEGVRQGLGNAVAQRATAGLAAKRSALESMTQTMDERLENLKQELAYTAVGNVAAMPYLASRIESKVDPKRNVMLSCTAAAMCLTIASKMLDAPDLSTVDWKAEIGQYFKVQSAEGDPIIFDASAGIGPQQVLFTITIRENDIGFTSETRSRGKEDSADMVELDQAGAIALVEEATRQITNLITAIDGATKALGSPRYGVDRFMAHAVGMVMPCATSTLSELIEFVTA